MDSIVAGIAMLPLKTHRDVLSSRQAICRFLLLAFLLLLSTAAQAVTYANTAIAYNWIDATTHIKLGPTLGGVYSPTYKFSNTGGCGTNPPAIDDSMSDNLPIGFTFMYGGVSFTQVRIMSNGRLQFNNTTCGFGSPVTQLPYPDAGLNYTMRVYGGDLDPSLQSEIGGGYTTSCISRATCFVSYATLGIAPYRSFVVTWKNVPEWTTGTSATGSYSLQVILQENGEFIYQYGANTPGPGYSIAQVGWQVDSNDYDVPAVGFPGTNTAIKFYIARPVAEYRFEQPNWNGTANEVLDTSGNALHGTALLSGATTRPADVATGQVCRGAQIANNTTTAAISAINSGISIPTDVGSVGTITFWYNNASNAPNLTRMLFDASTVNNRWFYLTRSNNRALSFNVTDSGNTNRTVTTANNAIPAAGWSHIAVTWNFNNLAAANSDHLNIWVDGVLVKTTAFTTNNAISNQIDTLYLGDNRSGVSSTGNSAGNPGGTSATLDEFRIYNYEGGAGLVQRDMSLAGACLNHYAISHAGTGQACQTNNVTITAHDATHGLIIMPNNTTQITLGTATGLGDWSLVSGYGVLNNGTANDGIATYIFNGEYQAVFGLTHSAPGNVNINVSDGQIVEGATEDPTLILSACISDFNACHNYASSNCSAASGRLYTRLTGIAGAIDVVALDGSDNVSTSFTGKAVVSLIARSTTGAVVTPYCFTPDYTLVLDNALTGFTAGRLNLASVTVPNAYPDVRIKVVCDATNCPPSGMTWCSTDNFAIRPQSFSVSSNMNADATGVSTNATPVLNAGANFTITASTGVAGYNGTPLIDLTKLAAHGGAVANGTVSGSFPAATPATGNTSGTTFGYNEVGYFRFLAGGVYEASFTSVDQPNDCTADFSNTAVGGKYGCKIGNSANTAFFGRFAPDHFVLLPASSITPACGGAGGFTYMGQPLLGVNAVVEAQNTGNSKTQNYNGGFARATTAMMAENGNDGNDLSARLSLAGGAWSSGTYTLNSAAGTFSRLASPDGAFDSLQLGVKVADPDTATLAGLVLGLRDMNSTTTGDCTLIPNCTGKAIGTTKVRYGRVKLSNAHGSELLQLPIPIALQYYSSNGWISNTADICSVINAGDFAFSSPGNNLAACETAMGVSGSAPNYILKLAAAGSGNNGWTDLTLNLGAIATGNTCTAKNAATGFTGAATTANLPWLQFPWGGAGATNPSSRATFGVYKGADEFIYLRENY